MAEAEFNAAVIRKQVQRRASKKYRLGLSYEIWGASHVVICKALLMCIMSEARTCAIYGTCVATLAMHTKPGEKMHECNDTLANRHKLEYE